ncbi:MAG: Na+/H+ antiporter NhaA [Sulfuricurvum sp.]|nr:Na+/H+ antiporter NhaA [Sulfuricurvum sp.]
MTHFGRFFKLESATGILLILAMFIAMAMANTPLSLIYNSFLSLPVVVSIGSFVIAKPFLLWINDGLMTIFFLMVGMEIKREVLEGSLKEIGAITIPVIAALGGMVVPSLIYAYFNLHDRNAIEGWAIPSATDIAFALGILALLGKRIPAGLKFFLLTLAIVDDLGAIIIIALFYTSELSLVSIALASVIIMILLWMNLKGVTNHTAYILIGIILWGAVLKSGVHATLAGVMIGLLIPLKNNKTSFYHLEHSLHAPVNFVILPLFAFANTGIGFGNITIKDFTDNITLGIALGLFLGKQVGVFLFSAVAIKMGLGQLPKGVNWLQLYGVALLSGIGFTMSLFIGSLAFEEIRSAGIVFTDERLGVLIGSIASATMGYWVLKLSLQREDVYE